MALRAMRERRFSSSAKQTPTPASKEEPMARKTGTKAGKAENGKEKKAIVASMLSRKTGCTSADVKKATGWPSVSMPQMAKSCGLKLRKEKTAHGTRYYGSAA